MMDSRMEWARSRDQLVSAIRDLGFPEELGEQIAKQLRSPKAMDRMKGYLYNVKPRSAELIVDEMLAICSDIDRWREKKAYHDKGFAKFFWGGKSAVMAEKPELEEVSVDLSGYDRIIFGFPVWASNFTPPLRTFIEEHSDELRDKKFSAFVCQSGSGADNLSDTWIITE